MSLVSFLVTGAQSAAAAIPFREEGSGVAATATGPLMVAVLLLAGLGVAAWYAKRRGWLDRWLGPLPTATSQPQLRVEQVLRLSPKTTLYRIRDGHRRLTVIESSVNARLHDEGEVSDDV